MGDRTAEANDRLVFGVAVNGQSLCFGHSFVSLLVPFKCCLSESVAVFAGEVGGDHILTGDGDRVQVIALLLVADTDHAITIVHLTLAFLSGIS